MWTDDEVELLLKYKCSLIYKIRLQYSLHHGNSGLRISVISYIETYILAPWHEGVIILRFINHTFLCISQLVWKQGSDRRISDP